MEKIFLSILSISLSTSVVILALIVLGSLINKRYVAKWKYGIWIVLALRLLVPVHYELPDAQFQITIPAEVGSLAVSDVFEAQPSVLNVQLASPQVTEPVGTGPQTIAPLVMQPNIPEDEESSFTLLQALGYLWAAGAICLLAWQLTGFIFYKRKIVKRGSSTENPVLLEQLRELTQELGIRKQVALLIYKNANSPMIIGFWRPILVLPGEEYTREESFYILRHELIHLRRHDVFVKFLLLLARDFHWFNPVVYMMHREAVVDMELACDEAVVKGGSYAQKEAYTETLMSTLHRQQGGGPLLSTQFSGSKRIMKKRFQNILSKTRKRNGVILFAVILLLTVTVGTMVGYAMEEPAPKMQEEMPEGNMEEVDNGSEEETADAGTTREPTTTLTLIREGFEEEEPATLYVGEGYSFYLIDGAWVQTSSGSWHATFHERIQLWIDKYEGFNLNQVEEILTEQGYEVSDAGLSAGLRKYEADTDNMYRVYCYETEDAVWTMNSVYFLEAEEGYGVGIRAMFETFAVAEGYHEGGLSAGIDEDTPQINSWTEDAQELENVMTSFYTAYFDKDIETTRQYLAQSFGGKMRFSDEIDSLEEVKVFGIKGLDSSVQADVGDECELSLEFRLANEDSLTYLTVGFVKEDTGWKVGYYGMEK